MKTTTLVGALAAITFAVIISTGCTKTIVNDIYDCECVDTCDTVTTPPPPPSCTETGEWIGKYNALTSVVSRSDDSFIKNGIAKLTDSASPFDYYFTSYELNMPSCRNLSGDSVRFDARVKNPLSEGAIEELDVTLIIIGEQDSAWVNYVGRTYASQHTYLGLRNGNSISNVDELVQSFQDWTEVSLEVKNDVISTYRNGTKLKSYTVPNAKKIGRIKEIRVGFKGTGSVDWVKVYNDAGVLKLREEFNTNNNSSVEWF